jgi:hypothetical protein
LIHDSSGCQIFSLFEGEIYQVEVSIKIEGGISKAIYKQLEIGYVMKERNTKKEEIKIVCTENLGPDENFKKLELKSIY